MGDFVYIVLSLLLLFWIIKHMIWVNMLQWCWCRRDGYNSVSAAVGADIKKTLWDDMTMRYVMHRSRSRRGQCGLDAAMLISRTQNDDSSMFHR